MTVHLTDFHPSPASQFKTFQVFLIYFPKCPSFRTTQSQVSNIARHQFLPQIFKPNWLVKIAFFLFSASFFAKTILGLISRVHVAPFVMMFGGLEVACWPLVPKFAGSNPGRSRRIFLRVNKNPQHVGGHGWLSVVCCQVEVSATN